MRKLSDFILMSDVDGTLLLPDQPVCERNVETLRRFTERGGRFGIATGRSKEATVDFVKTLPVNAPCVVYNGGGVYDYTAEKFLYEEFLPPESREYVLRFRERLPEIPVLVITNGNYFDITGIPFFSFSAEYRRHFGVAPLEELTTPWYKALFAVEPEKNERFWSFLRETDFPGVRFVQTNASLVEMLPAGSSKGKALAHLVELGIFKKENIVAIGDYYNDLEMILFAGIGVTLCDSPDDIKTAADLVVGTCAGGAVADVVEHLESLCG